MDIKDDVVRLYVKRFVIPRALIFDKPGFVDFKISGKTNVFARQLLVPETFFVLLEEQIVKKYGEKGKRALYSIGKKFGYSFSQLGRFENINDHPGDAIKDWIIIASKFVEGTYASEITQKTNVKEKVVDFSLKNFVICRRLGYDFFLATGGAAGVIAWLLQDKTIEGYYYDNKFEKEEHRCKVKCAPADSFKKSYNIFRETDLDDLAQNIQMYNKFNEEVIVRYTKSFSNYLDARVFDYRNGIILLNSNKERFFLMEVQCIYLLELILKENSMYTGIFDIAYTMGETLFGQFGTKIQPLLELMTALGWGEIILLPEPNDRIKIVINHFPWTKWYKDIDYSIINGFLSGMFSKIYKRKIKFNKPQIDINNNYLTLVFQEN